MFKRRFFFLLGLALLALAPHAHASSGGAGLPWESPLTQLSNSVTGPVPYAISLVGVVVLGGTMLFGHDLHGWGRGTVLLVLVISMIVFAKNFLTGLGFSAGAEVGRPETKEAYGLATRHHP